MADLRLEDEGEAEPGDSVAAAPPDWADHDRAEPDQRGTDQPPGGDDYVPA